MTIEIPDSLFRKSRKIQARINREFEVVKPEDRL
jgi:hypothetical protein